MLAAVVAGLGVWIGGALGAYTLIGGVFFLWAPTVLYSLQMGNFQSTAMALGALALIASGVILIAAMATSIWAVVRSRRWSSYGQPRTAIPAFP